MPSLFLCSFAVRLDGGGDRHNTVDVVLFIIYGPAGQGCYPLGQGVQLLPGNDAGVQITVQVPGGFDAGAACPRGLFPVRGGPFLQYLIGHGIKAIDQMEGAPAHVLCMPQVVEQDRPAHRRMAGKKSAAALELARLKESQATQSSKAVWSGLLQ